MPYAGKRETYHRVLFAGPPSIYPGVGTTATSGFIIKLKDEIEDIEEPNENGALELI